MRVKVSFICESDKWNSIGEYKKDFPKVKSRKDFEEKFKKQIQKMLDCYLFEEAGEKIEELKVKIVERKDSNER